jgi:hypothetical protein
MMRTRKSLALYAGLAATIACEPAPDVSPMQAKVDQYATVPLTADLSVLSDNERQMIPLLVEVGQIMDDLFWHQAYGNRDSLLEALTDPAARRYAEINYGVWDRLAGNEPFLPEVGPKPAGANLYPTDATKEEVEAAAAQDPALLDLYTIVRRDAEGRLVALPYHEVFADQLTRAAALLGEAAALAEDPGLRTYLELRAEALITGEYRASDMAWMDMKNNRIEVVVGPIESYEDQLFGAKASFETFVLLKDMEWSDRLSRFAQYLPDLQRGLPVPDAYKAEMPGSDSDLNAYDAVYYAGDANAGSKTIAINLPNDEAVQLAKGTRRLQLKNSMRAKFDEILVPLSDVLIAEDQREYVTFDAFFANTMFHEVAHGLGVKNTIDGRGTVREALQETASSLEEGKADILGLYMITWLREQGAIEQGRLEDNYVTFLASIFRSVRFGASSAHGRANMIRFNFFKERGAFSRDDATGTYRVDFDGMADAMRALSELIVTLQGDGNYDGVRELIDTMGAIGPDLQSDLDRLADAGIPVDIVFEQGLDVMDR